MLGSMPQSAPQTAPQTAEVAAASQFSSFAGLLAALAAPTSKPSPSWQDENLADDVVTLSYEQALQTHARYRPAAAEAQPAAEAGVADAEVAEKAAVRKPVQPVQVAQADGRKCASITIRLTQAEGDQLRERAAEAGMTISAYLRSCTFEAEALRTQVKEALAELRPAAARPSVSAEHRWWRLWPQEERRSA